MLSNDEVRQYFQKMVDLPDVLTGLKRLADRPYNRNYRSDPRIHVQIHRGQAARNWEGAPKGGCSRCKALFNDFDVIPKYCFDCYKILIELSSVLDLFKLLMIFDRIELPRNNSRKCMAAVNSPTHLKYKGFVFCRGFPEASELCQIVREKVYNDISPGVSIKIKRGCSEFVQKYPAYEQINTNIEKFEYGKDWQFYEDYVDKCWIFGDQVDCYDEDGMGTDPVREIAAYQYWLRFAATIGDRSYLVLTGGKILEPLTSA